jgi:hypothetical protein
LSTGFPVTEAATQDALQPPPMGWVAAVPAQAGPTTSAGREPDGDIR